MAQDQFLLGRGHLLTESIPRPKGGGAKKSVYTINETKKRLVPQLHHVSSTLDDLPKALCPNDLAVIQMALNPSFIAKSYFPSTLLKSMGLSSLGSKSVRLVPEKWQRKGNPEECSTTQLFIAGKRSTFRQLPDKLSRMTGESAESDQFCMIERVSLYDEAERFKPNESGYDSIFEVGIHVMPDSDDYLAILEGFRRYTESLEGEIVEDARFELQGLVFFPVRISKNKVGDLVKFSFVRVVRPMPALRSFDPLRSVGAGRKACELPAQAARSSEPQVALLDGGLPSEHPLANWTSRGQVEDAWDNPEAQSHGLAVASAFLFGPINPSAEIEPPVSRATCIPVIARPEYDGDGLELYATLANIESVLLSHQYQFMNLSLGPDLPIEDDEVHAWTSVIDYHLEDGGTLMTVAVGNNGQMDPQSGNARIQVPSDCVNAMSVGASDRSGNNGWSRAPYSALGPGRRPGVIKPDVVAFGGSDQEPFHYLSPGLTPALDSGMGTSFSAPFVLRTAVSVRAMIGAQISPLAIKTLLIHTAKSTYSPDPDYGWGLVQPDISDIVLCQDGMVRVVYNGKLLPGKFLRARVPVPEGGIKGKVEMTATFCYASKTDPADASSYTRSGLNITFRRDLDKKSKGSDTPESSTFFKMAKYATEAEQRSDHGKWETVLHDSCRMLGSKLNKPAFDIHHNARRNGAPTGDAEPISYALVITLQAPKHPTLYSDVLSAYSSVLAPLEPQVDVPVRT